MTSGIPQHQPYEHTLFMVSGSLLRHMYRLGLTYIIIYHFELTVKNSRQMSSTQFWLSTIVEGDREAGTRENRDGRWAGSGRRRSGMRESCEGGRRENNERH